MRLVSFCRDVWRNRRGLVNAPRFLTYLVTFKCNARCIMCDSWKKPSPDELTIEEVERIFQQLPRMDAVRLSGGEPFVRADLAAIAGLAARYLRPQFLHVTTNGFLTDRIVQFCEQRQRSTPLRLLVSLDGTEAKHNEVRGLRTAWKTAFATLRALAGRQEELGMKLAVNQTVVDHSGLAEHRQLRELLRPLGISLNTVVAYDLSATYSTLPGPVVAPPVAGQYHTFGNFSPAQAEALLSELEAGLPDLPWAERTAKAYYYAGLRQRLLHGVGQPNPKCVALNSHLRLFPNGDVPVCQFNSRTVGNLRRQSFNEVWYGEPIGAEREWVSRCAGCWAECEVLPNAVYSGDLVRRGLLGNGR